MFTNILLASDGSECALKAAVAAATLASKFTARLTIINVFQPIPAYGPFREVVNSDLHEQYVRELQEHAISPAGRIMEGMGVPYQSRREIGSPPVEIMRVAEAEGCDLIVLGSRGLSDVKAFLIGSVSDRVAHHAHCPVLIVK